MLSMQKSPIKMMQNGESWTEGIFQKSSHNENNWLNWEQEWVTWFWLGTEQHTEKLFFFSGWRNNHHALVIANQFQHHISSREKELQVFHQTTPVTHLLSSWTAELHVCLTNRKRRKLVQTSTSGTVFAYHAQRTCTRFNTSEKNIPPSIVITSTGCGF